MSKKLQVFVSSTYSDMKVERQAVIEAILRAGHIPAGMELFAAGDKSQLEIIKRWIQDSDVFMLILGGRYGTIEPDSGKSYVQVEYEFADSTNKPYFAAVMHDEFLGQKVKVDGRDIFEQDHPDLLRQFRGQVTSKICRFFKSTEELKLIVLESLLDIERNRELVGWVRADALPNPAPLIEEIGQLRKENTALREELGQAKAQLPSAETYGGYEFKGLFERLDCNVVETPKFLQENHNLPSNVSVLVVFWNCRRHYCAGIRVTSFSPNEVGDWLAGTIANEVMLYGLVDKENITEFASPIVGQTLSSSVTIVKITPIGRSFLGRLDRDEQMKSQIIPLGT